MAEEAEYSNREVDTFMKEIHDTLTRIEAQTTKTNGRVSKLEGYRTGIIMCLALISFIVIPLVVAYFAIAQINIKNEILLQIQQSQQSTTKTP